MHFFRWLLLVAFLIIVAGVSVVVWRTASAPQRVGQTGAPAPTQSAPVPAPSPSPSPDAAAQDAARRAAEAAKAAGEARAAAEARSAADARVTAHREVGKSAPQDDVPRARGVPSGETPNAAPPVIVERSAPLPSTPDPKTACLSDQICTPVRVYFNTIASGLICRRASIMVRSTVTPQSSASRR